MKTIMIADDEHDILEVLAFVLNAQGYEVATAGNGNEAYALLQSTHVDLIISDFMMPGMNGMELHAKVRDHPEHKNLPFILISAFPCGVSDNSIRVLSKPFDVERLLKEVAEAL